MTFSTLNIRKNFLKTALVVAALSMCLSAQAANDIDFKRQSIFDSTASHAIGFDSTRASSISEQNNEASMTIRQGIGNSIAAPHLRDRQPASVLLWLADSDREFRSKSDVVREVKERYDARVLKITLDEKRAVYKVRILMPGGKVRNITLSAKS